MLFAFARQLYKMNIRFDKLAKKCKIRAYRAKYCDYCGQSITEANFTLDHVIPKHAGGLDTPDNLRVCCRSCNKYKGPFHLETFRKRGIGRYSRFYFESGKPIAIDYSNCYISKYARQFLTKTYDKRPEADRSVQASSEKWVEGD